MEAHDCNFHDALQRCISDRCPLHRAMRTLAANLKVVGFGAAMFRAGDNFGFHMGSDESQCTCQWSPNTHGEAYRGSTRCEQEELYDPADWNTDCPHCDGYGCSSCDPLVGGEA